MILTALPPLFPKSHGKCNVGGVITSMYLQLHDYMPFERIAIRYDACVQDQLDETQAKAWNDLAQKFEILFLLDPFSIDVSEARSNACGWPTADPHLSCYGEGAGTYFDAAWKRYLNENRSVLETQGIAPAIIDRALSCTPYTIEDAEFSDQGAASAQSTTTILKFKDYAEAVTLPPGTAYPGKAVDSPLPGYGPSNYQMTNVLVPKKWILENIDLAIAFASPNLLGLGLDISGYRAFGGKASSSASDGSNSLSSAHREAGYMFNYPHTLGDDFFSLLMPQWFDMSGDSGFPAYLGVSFWNDDHNSSFP